MGKKLTEEDVVSIKKMLAKGNKTREEIADAFDVEVTAIKRISAGRTWSHVKGPKPKRTANVATDFEVKEQLIQRWQRGERVKDIAEDLGIDWSTAYRLIRKYRER